MAKGFTRDKGRTGNEPWRREMLLYRKYFCEKEEERCDRKTREVDLHKGKEPIRQDGEEKEESLEKGV